MRSRFSFSLFDTKYVHIFPFSYYILRYFHLLFNSWIRCKLFHRLHVQLQMVHVCMYFYTRPYFIGILNNDTDNITNVIFMRLGHFKRSEVVWFLYKKSKSVLIYRSDLHRRSQVQFIIYVNKCSGIYLKDKSYLYIYVQCHSWLDALDISG